MCALKQQNVDLGVLSEVIDESILIRTLNDLFTIIRSQLRERDMDQNNFVLFNSVEGETRRLLTYVAYALPLFILGCGLNRSSGPVPSNPTTTATQHILFVGDSFTHGRYLPVRTYNNTPDTGGIGSTVASAQVVDENFNTTVKARKETQPGETGPWGGIPGIFAQLAQEAGLPYDVHIEAISATPLIENYNVAQDVIDRPLWNAVVLQEASFQPIPVVLSQNSKSDPAVFCNAVGTIERGIHNVAENANVYLYQTWAPADTAYSDSYTSSFSPSAYLTSLGQLSAAYHDVYLDAAAQDGHIAGIAPVGDAWSRAWNEGVANSDPYGGSATGVSLSFNYQPGSEPATIDKPTDAGYHHPSIYGAYLSGLVLFQKITGSDVRIFGATEQAAATLGISPAVSTQLQWVAWEAVTQQSNQLVKPDVDLCSLTH